MDNQVENKETYMTISAFQQLQGVPSSGAATQSGGDPSMLIEALPYLLSMLGSAVSPEGSPIQQIANQIGNLAQRKAVTQYIARKKIDPKTPAPLGLSPEIQMQVDNAIAQENAMNFQQEMAVEMQKLEQQRTQSEIDTNKGQLGVAQARAKTDQESLAADSAYKKEALAIQKAQNAAQQDYLNNRISLDKMLADKQITQMEYNTQLEALDKASRLYLAGLDTEEIGNTFGSTFGKLGVNFDKPPAQNVTPPVSSASVPAISNQSTYQNFLDLYGNILGEAANFGFNQGMQAGSGNNNQLGFPLPNFNNIGMPRQSKKALQDLYPYVEQLLPRQSQNALKGLTGK